MATKIKRGATIVGKINLRTKPDQGAVSTFPYTLPVTRTIELRFPGANDTIVSLTELAGEVTIISSTEAQLGFIISATKSALLAVTTSAAVDCIVTNTGVSPNVVDIFEQTAVFNISDMENS